MFVNVIHILNATNTFKNEYLFPFTGKYKGCLVGESFFTIQI